MNILFATAGMINPEKGGTERATVNVARGLAERYGCKCFSIYERKDSDSVDDCITESIYWNISRFDAENISFLKSVITRLKIDVVIVQGAFIHVRRFKLAAKDSGCKVIFAHHFEPGAETMYFTYKSVFKRKITSWRGFARTILDAALFPVQKKKADKALSGFYRQAAEYADAIVLLSSLFIEPFNSFGGTYIPDNKFEIIPNSLSFPITMDDSCVDRKSKSVLIVSRLEETHKRLSLALQIWETAKKDSRADGWKLIIVGEGEERNRYERFVKQRQIPDVSFEGRQNPVSYYQKASIFMMTSRSESWGLTLTESQQHGVVPIAFHSYPSVTDIIDNGYNGVIIPEGKVREYVEALLALMDDKDHRKLLALNGLKSCQRFASEKIILQWHRLLEKITA